jgi:hypothetical protein
MNPVQAVWVHQPKGQISIAGAPCLRIAVTAAEGQHVYAQPPSAAAPVPPALLHLLQAAPE